MYIAVIDNVTNSVVNTVVPPRGSDVWFCGEGFTGVLTDTGKIGDIYDAETGVFTTPEQPAPEVE